jgi:molybdenum cofactor biosynthesis protein B
MLLVFPRLLPTVGGDMPTPSAPDDHRKHAPAPAAIRVAIVTASDSRTEADNEGGRLLRELAEKAGLAVVGEALLREEPEALRDHVASLSRAGAADAALVTGGTGLAPRDRTPEAVGALFDRRIDGFGELFRVLSFQEIGPAAMLSRASAGVVGDMLVFLLPGSPAAVRLAMERLILPELPHAVGQLRRKPHGHAHEHGHGHGHGR